MRLFKKKEMSKGETLLACAKLMTKIFKEQANEYNGNTITYTVDNITDKKTSESYGSIKIEWRK